MLQKSKKKRKPNKLLQLKKELKLSYQYRSNLAAELHRIGCDYDSLQFKDRQQREEINRLENENDELKEKNLNLVAAINILGRNDRETQLQKKSISNNFSVRPTTGQVSSKIENLARGYSMGEKKIKEMLSEEFDDAMKANCAGIH